MATVAPGRSTRAGCRFTAPLVIVASLLAAGLTLAAPASAAGDVDVSRFSARAVAWSAANVVHQEAAIERAIALGEEQAAAEAEWLDALATTTTTTTTTIAPPTTTAVPTTTTVPPTTAPPTTEAPPATDPPADTGDPAEATAPAETTTTTTEAPAGGPTPEQWEALRQCESGGRYDALSRGGRYRGAYQFSQATWDWVASFANPALAGVDPAAASVADQDAQAQALYDRQGSGPWPTCGRFLP